jgi:hypothetical protein
MTRGLVIRFAFVLVALILASPAMTADPGVAKSSSPTRGTGVDPVVFKGPGYHFSLVACDGWSIEPTGKTDGEIAQLFAHHDSGGTAPVLINVRVDPTPEPRSVEFNAAIRATLVAIKKDNPGLTLTKDSDIVTVTKQSALMFSFRRETTGLREAWAALDAGGAIIRIMYVTRDEGGFRKYLDDFHRTVASYTDLAPKRDKKDKEPEQKGPEKLK